MAKKVIIICLMEQWIGISRLPQSLKNAGFEVYVLCPEKSYIAKTKFVDGRVLFRTFTYSRSKLVYFAILYFLLRFKSDLIIPGDEEALLALQNLANNLKGLPYLNIISSRIRMSIGDAEYDGVMLSKSLFMESCRYWQIRSPQNENVESKEDALTKAKSLGYPVVLKTNFGYGASGVNICQNETDLLDAVSRFQNISPIKKMRDFLKSIFFVVPKGEGLSIQKYIQGSIGLVPFVASHGQLLDANPMLKHRTYPGTTGPSSVCKGIENQEIIQMARQICRKMCYNGFGSLDFIIDEKTNTPFIIELNPRPVPTSHLSYRVCSVDLCDSLAKHLRGKMLAHKEFRPFLVALFPNEKRRDPLSPFLKEAFHDVPYDDPGLRAILDS